MYTRRSLELDRSAIGRARSDAATPALLLDLDVAKRNIAAMAARLSSRSAALRPHVKVHKSPQLALLQMEAGAIGVTCATVWEAEAMAEAGIRDILIANQVVQPDKVQALAALARRCRMKVAVDDIRNVDALDAAAQAAGSRLGLLIELDIGMGRCGVRSKEELLAVARHISGKQNVRFRGMQGYEGHCMLEPDASVRERKALAAYGKLREAVDFLSASGFPSEIVSGGGTGTYAWAVADPVFTEIQAGSYALMDGFHGGLIPGAFEPALTVLGTVISEQGSTVVLDVGSKSINANEGSPLIRGIDYEAIRFDEEHGIVTFAGAPQLRLGDRAELVPGYGPSTVNLHDVYHVVERDIIIDVWPVLPRGPGRPWRDPGGNGLGRST